MAIAKRQRFGDYAVFVGCSRTCARFEEETHNIKVAIGSCKVKRCRAFSTGTGGTFGFETGCIDVGTMEDEHADTLLAAAGTSGMKRQDAVEVAVGGLTILEGEFDEADVASGCSVVQT